MRRMTTLVLALYAVVASLCALPSVAAAANVWFPPDWKEKAPQAKAIADALAAKSGVPVQPRIAKSYPEILEAFASGDQNLVYVGSFVQAIIKDRGLGTPLAQAVNGKELYAGIMVYPKGEDPAAILAGAPEQIAYALGASSGESCAKAATGGKAAVGVPSHGAACNAVKAGKAKAAMVKNWWWEGNKDKFPELAVYEVPGISLVKNPDNVLTASKAVPADLAKKLADAALASTEAFGAPQMAPFDAASLEFSLELMRKGNIDPKTYSW
ncbi:MAG: PhnD/SsuA/transferrin family substrate-binding protein [Thermodesulfobacteriota bacterium]